MATETDLDKFARVENGEITEYPVYRCHIKNRSHPTSWYLPVVDGAKPELPAFHYYKTVLSVKGTYVEANYIVLPYTLNELLTVIRRGKNVMPGMESEDITIADVDADTINRVYILGGEYVTNLLNAFAQTRHYDNIASLIAHLPSTVEKLKTEAARGLYLQDKCWAAVITYFDQVIAGQLPIPKSTATIDALLPTLTWEETEAPSATATETAATDTATAAPVATDTQAETADTLAASSTAGIVTPT